MILVTGGCGYIGSHIVNVLNQIGHEVVVFDNLSFGKKTNLLNHQKLVIGDIINKSDLQKVFASHSIDLVIHAAALVNASESIEKPDLYQSVNDIGSQNVWQQGVQSGVKHFIYLSSAAVYGVPSSEKPILETAPTNPINPYGTTKLAGEKSLKKIVKSKVNYIIFRFFNVAGAEKEARIGQSKDSLAIIPQLFATASGIKKFITIYGKNYQTHDGTVIRDFIHVQDIVLAIVKAVKHLRNNKESCILNLGSGQTTSINQLIKIVKTVTRQNILIKYGPPKQGDIPYSLADITKAKQILNWKPKHNLTGIIKDGWNYHVKT